MSAKKSPMSVMFTCRDVPRSIAFYCDLLGFELREAWPDPDNPMWCSLDLDGQTVMLGVNATDDCGTPAAEHDMDAAQRWMVSCMQGFDKHPAGTGAFVYVMVSDVDEFHRAFTGRGGKSHYEPKSQFYGIRDFAVTDPDGYQLIIYQNITLSSCQSCGMPLTEAKPGQMYCDHCTDESGQLRPYEAIFEGTVTGYFMGMQKMERAAAEAAPKEHLGRMPAWGGSHSAPV